jgi:NADH/NAD ratio-sensing transcriptional regulator Rex
MSCIRNGNTYKRHNVKSGTCVKCGAISVPSEQAEKIKEMLISKAVKVAIEHDNAI